jgi:hypothetical protein
VSAFARLAANYVEAGWLLIAVAAALLFQVIANRSFDFPRATLLLVVAPWLAGAAALAATAQARSDRSVSDEGLLGRRALPWLASGLLASSYVVSTALSIAPTTSFWGGRFNAEGCAVALGYATVLALVATFMRRADQVERLLDVMLLASIPVALYGVAQYVGYDPLASAMSTQLEGGRVVSSLGNPILAGGYAAMLMPITLARTVATLRRGLGGRSAAPVGGAVSVGVLGPAARLATIVALQAAALGFFLWAAARYPQLWWIAPAALVLFLLPALIVPPVAPLGRLGLGLALAAYLALFGLQFLLFFLARSRGPFVAAPLALALTLFLLLGARRQQARVAAVGVVGSLVVLAVVGLPALARISPALAETPALAAIGRIGGPVGTVSSRWLIWTGVLDLAVGRHQVGTTEDRLVAIRPLIGYGPETLALAYEAVATAEARQAEPYRISRAHDEPLDVLATRGALGLAVWAFVVGALALATWRASQATDRGGAALAGAAGAAAAYLIEQLFEPNDPSLSLHFWLLAGLVLSRALQMPACALVLPGASGAPLAPRGSHAPLGRSDRKRGRGRARPAARSASAARPTGQTPAAVRWAVGSLLLAGAALLGTFAAVSGSYDLLGWLLVGWLAIALGGIAWAFLPGEGTPAAGDLARGLGIALPLVLVALWLSMVAFRRLEGDAYSKYGLEAARRGELAAAFALSRSAVALTPDDELLYANLARVVVSAANAAGDQATRGEFKPSLALLFGMQPQQIGTFGKRELLQLTLVWPTCTGRSATSARTASTSWRGPSSRRCAGWRRPRSSTSRSWRR